MVSAIFHWLQLYYFLTSIIFANSNIYQQAIKTNLHRFDSTLKDYILLQKRCHILYSTPDILLFLLINVSMANSWGKHVFHKCVNGEQLGNPCLSQMCQWGTYVFHKCVNREQLRNSCLPQMCQWWTAGECMSFINVSIGNSWGTHVFHKCCLMRNSWGTRVCHKCVNGEQLGTHVFHKLSINIYIFRWLGVVVWLWRRVTDTDHEELR